MMGVECGVSPHLVLVASEYRGAGPRGTAPHPNRSVFGPTDYLLPVKPNTTNTL